MIAPKVAMFTPLVLAVALVACEPEHGELPFAVQAGARSTSTSPDWSAPENLGPIVNSSSEEFAPAISRDGLTLYFGSPRPLVGQLGFDIWASQRATTAAPWGPPQALGPNINVPFPLIEGQPFTSRDGHRLYFNSDRSGGFGGQDLYVSRRRGQRGDSAWENPVNLGSAINTAANEVAPFVFEDEASGTVTLYFASNRPGGQGATDIYASTQLPDGSFGAPLAVAELNTPSNDNSPTIRRDGLEIFITSNRPGTLGGDDVWVATRASTAEPGQRR